MALPDERVRAQRRESTIASPNEVTAAASFEALQVWAGVSKGAGATQHLSTSVAAAQALWAAEKCVLVDACCVGGK